MSKSIKDVDQAVSAEVKHFGDQLLIPDGMSVQEAIDLLKRRQSYLEEEVIIRRTYNVFPQDGANALNECLSSRYGWAAAEATPGFFGSNPPQMLDVDTDYGVTKKVPWGRFSLPNVQGFVQTSVGQRDGRYVFELVSKVLRKDEKTIEGLFDDVGAYLKKSSIYSGKAIKISFRASDGELLEMPEPEFLRTSHISRDMLVYSKEIETQIEVNLFTPISRLQDCRDNGIPTKRGVLLGGPYGTGKTMAATVASKLAVDAGITYLYVPHSSELADAIQFAKQYSHHTATVIFCEDIDRSVTGERSEAMDDILNILDGIDSKSTNIIVVLTTNHLENINPAMLRPGRLDAIINVEAPDAEAVQRLIRLYGGESIQKDEDLTKAGKQLDGTIPAVIAEVLKRAKLAQLSLQEPGTKVRNITGEAIYNAALTMTNQIELLRRMSEKKVVKPTLDSVMRELIEDKVSELV